jgi:hypothetical protein
MLGPYITFRLFQSKGEMCAKFGSDSFRNVNLYKVQTHKYKKLRFIHKIVWLPKLFNLVPVIPLAAVSVGQISA